MGQWELPYRRTHTNTYNWGLHIFFHIRTHMHHIHMDIEACTYREPKHNHSRVIGARRRRRRRFLQENVVRQVIFLRIYLIYPPPHIRFRRTPSSSLTHILLQYCFLCDLTRSVRNYYIVCLNVHCYPSLTQQQHNIYNDLHQRIRTDPAFMNIHYGNVASP